MCAEDEEELISLVMHLLHELGGAQVVDAPQGDDGGGGARGMEAAREAKHALGFDRAAKSSCPLPQERQQVRAQRVRRYAVFSDAPPLPE